MKKLWFLMIVILAAFSLFISACGDDDDDNIDITNPDDADWVLAFFQLPDNLRSGFMFEAWWNGESTAITEADVFTLEVGGTSIPVESYFYANEWIISGYDFPLNTGTTYEVKFYKNGNLIVSKNVKTCYPASCDFPATYNPTQATTLNWTVPENTIPSSSALVQTIPLTQTLMRSCFRLATPPVATQFRPIPFRALAQVPIMSWL